MTVEDQLSQILANQMTILQNQQQLATAVAAIPTTAPVATLSTSDETVLTTINTNVAAILTQLQPTPATPALAVTPPAAA